MSYPQTIGGTSRPGRIIGPSLDKIIKNVAWRKHSQLVSAAKAAIDKLETLTDSSDPTSLLGFSRPDADLVLVPLILAIESAYIKIVEPALECVWKLFCLGLIRGEVDRPQGNEPPSVEFRMIDSICKCGGLNDEGIELAVLKVLLSAVRSSCVLIRGECLNQIVKTCYNVYFGSQSGTSQICAKAVLAQILTIVFARVEEDSMDVMVRPVSVVELLELSDKTLNDLNLVRFVQNFINDAMEGSEGVPIAKKPLTVSVGLQNGIDGRTETNNEGPEQSSDSKIREDGFLLFKNVCKLSMKFSAQDNPDDPYLLRGKVLSLELLKVVMENSGTIWRTNDRFLGAIKQYLCLSLLKNSALSVMSVFQLLCSILMSLLSKFRSGLKSEIGIFFPMLVLRVLENILQPSFLQKMTVLNFLEKISQDSQIIIDIFVNYDCDVDAPNIFERYPLSLNISLQLDVGSRFLNIESDASHILTLSDGFVMRHGFQS